MANVYFRFYDDLNDFLPRYQRHREIVYDLANKAGIKDTIEALGIPHTEVEKIVVNGEEVDFSYIIAGGEKCSIYPAVPGSKEYPEKFVLDVHLGKLANFLRMLGFDTLYRNHADDDELAEISSREERILLSRDRGLFKRSIVIYGYYVRETNPEKQLEEVLRRFNFMDKIQPFRVCINCNTNLEPVAKETVIDLIPPKARERYDTFSRCPSCSQIFWKGTHYEKMQKFIADLVDKRLS